MNPGERRVRTAWVVGLALAVPLVALGGATDATLLAAIVAICVACVTLALREQRAERRPTSRLIAFALWGVAAYELLQLVPLPMGLLSSLSPRSSIIWTMADGVLHAPPGARPISVDPPGTAFAAATALTVAAWFEVVSRVATAAAQRMQLLYALLFAVLAFDLIAVVHPLFGLETLYGVYAPKHALYRPSPLFAPLLNPNHAAAVSAVAPPLLLGIALETENAGARALAFAGAVLSVAVTILLLSRGGMAVIALELVAMGCYAALRRRGARRRVTALAPLVLIVAGAIALSVYVGLEPVLQETKNRDVSKLQIAKRALEVVRDFRWTGAGRGAFGSVFAAHEGITGGHRFSHAENWPAHLAAELGLPVTLAFVGAIGFALFRAARAAVHRPVGFGACVALVGLGVHDLFDFSMEFVGTAAIAAVLAAVVAENAAHRTSREPLSTRGRVLLAVACAASTLGAALLVRGQWGRGLDADLESVAATFRTNTTTEQAIAGAIRRHPAEPYFAMVAGARDLRHPDAPAHLLRAVKLGPYRANGHVWLARWFLAAGRRGQAWAEYREALRLDHRLAGFLAEEMVRGGASVDELVASSFDPVTLDAAARALGAHQREVDAATLDALLVQKHPPAVEARLRQIERARRSGDLALARRLADELVALVPTSPKGYLAASSVAEDPVAAEAALERGIGAATEVRELLEKLILTRGVRLGLDAVGKEIERYGEVVVATDGNVVAVHAIQGHVEMARKRPAAALKHYLDASAASYDGLAYLETAAQIAEDLDQLGIAHAAWSRLAAARPAETKYSLALERIRRKLAARPLPLPMPAPSPKG